MSELSFLDVTAADLTTQRLANRKAAAAARERIESRMGRFIYADVSYDEVEQRLTLVEDDLSTLAQEASDEYGGDDPESIVAAIKSSALNRVRQPEVIYSTVDGKSGTRTAAVHEAVRKPRMCPFHKDVVDISLAQGDPRAGFEALRDHWGGARHCEGEGYEGERCKFKPEMTTQSYWDDKAQKAQERAQERAEQAEHQQELEQGIDEMVEPTDTATEPVEDVESPEAEVLDFPGGEVSESPSEVIPEIPMGMAASVHTAPGGAHVPGASPKRNRQYEHIKENLIENGKDEDEAKEEAARTVNKQRAEHGETKDSRTAENVDGLGGPSPKIDKRKWTPENLERRLDTDDKGGRWPTREKDIIEPIVPDNSSDPKEIGEQVTEHVDVTQKKDQISQSDGSTWTEGPKTAVSSIPNDADVNPIRELVRGNYDGFLPANEVQQAIASYRR